MNFYRRQFHILRERWNEPSRFITIVAGPRQVGKTTLVRQALEGHAHLFVSVDPGGEQTSWPPGAISTESSEVVGAPRDTAWLIRRWQEARRQFADYKLSGEDKPFVFVIDEIQKIPRWSAAVKGLWDADRAQSRHMHVVLLGSSPLLIQRGLTESLAGRYELLRGTRIAAEVNVFVKREIEGLMHFDEGPVRSAQ